MRWPATFFGMATMSAMNYVKGRRALGEREDCEGSAWALTIISQLAASWHGGRDFMTAGV